MTSRTRSPEPPVHAITSAANPRVKLLRAIVASRGVRRHGRALVCGRRIVEEVARRHAGRLESLVYPSDAAALAPDLEDLARRRGDTAAEDLAPEPEVLTLPPALFREIDPVGVEPPLAVVRVEAPSPWEPARDRGGLTLFLPLGDPENVGAALRSAAAFAVDRVVLLAEAANPFLPRAIRAAAGACFDLDLYAGPPLAELLSAAPTTLELCVLDRDGEPISALGPAQDRGLVVGEEGRGVAAPSEVGPRGANLATAARGPVNGPPRPALRRVSIPISERVESLNAAVALGIALWELRGRRSG
ncbi:MAG TPA: TrmH family RNA methyltransferase [Thermoanaerobaculia bacterium]|nr:TrmH family RNA methyltransferase [Thermoanaerobaculia bacterium]